jgi:hypothetical protein
VRTSVVFLYLYSAFERRSRRRADRVNHGFCGSPHPSPANSWQTQRVGHPCGFGHGERWGCPAVIPRRAGANPFLHALLRDRVRSVDCWQMRRLAQCVGVSQSTDGACACVARRDYVMAVSAL